MALAHALAFEAVLNLALFLAHLTVLSELPQALRFDPVRDSPGRRRGGGSRRGRTRLGGEEKRIAARRMGKKGIGPGPMVSVPGLSKTFWANLDKIRPNRFGQ